MLLEEILHQLRLVVYSIIYRVMYIPGGAGVPPSTLWNWDRLKTHDASQQMGLV